MKSVADQLRAETMAADAARTFEERLAEALALGDRDTRLLALSRGVSEAEARRLVGRQRQQGRVYSPCHQSLFE